jgi:hypothetical protein
MLSSAQVVAAVLASISPHLNAVPVLQVIVPITLVFSPISMRVNPMPFRLVFNPVTFIFVSVNVPESTLAVRFVISPFPFVARPIRPNLNPVAVSTLLLTFQPLSSIPGPVFKYKFWPFFNHIRACSFDQSLLFLSVLFETFNCNSLGCQFLPCLMPPKPGLNLCNSFNSKFRLLRC